MIQAGVERACEKLLLEGVHVTDDRHRGDLRSCRPLAGWRAGAGQARPGSPWHCVWPPRMPSL